VASVARFIAHSPQIEELKSMEADDSLANVVRNWLAANFNFPSYCAYENRPSYGAMYVVNMASASALCTRALDPIDADHTEIVKPGDRNSPSYVAFKNAYITVQSELQQKTLATQTTALGNNSLVNNTGTILENEFSNNFVVNGGPDKLIITTNSGNIKNNNMSGNFIDGNVALLDNTGVIGNNQIDSNTIIPQAPFRIVDDSSPIQAPNGGLSVRFIFKWTVQ
jgi:hypothetical protein